MGNFVQIYFSLTETVIYCPLKDQSDGRISTMKLAFDETQLLELMKDFYLSTGIRIVLFDDEYQKLLSYPASDCSFCQLMKSHASTRQLCQQSDQNSFVQCSRQKRLVLYHCHAGLIEAVIPLLDNHIIIGYLMFGQISDCETADTLSRQLHSYLKNCKLEDTCDYTEGIALKTEAQIHAAAKIMEACTFYALFNETIALRRHHFTNNLHSYLKEHLAEPLDADSIAGSLGISRSKLYLACDKYLGTGIAEYVRTLRIDQAKILLKETSQSVTEISASTGFHDYNYFCKVFKKFTGMTPGEFRKKTAL